MPVIAAAVGFAALVWWAIYARRGSLLVGCGLLVAVGYVFGREFWHAKIGPLPLTIDRLSLVALLAAFAVQWCSGQVKITSLKRSDWILVVLIVLLGTSAALAGQPDFADGVTSKWGRLVASFILPAVLYCLARYARITAREWTLMLVGFVVLGVYLAATACLEIGGRWIFVFPRYISDPNLGIHFGRARGPELNAASLGLYLTACLLCGCTLLRHAQQRWQQLVLLAVLPLMALAVVFTYTRSTWMGLAASACLIAAIQIPRHWRLPALTGAALAAILIAAASWGHIVGLQREGTAAEAHHSVNQRTSFAYVSWQMFRDHPIFGVGFGRFYDRKLPYLSDRSQDFELESLRGLHHHNTLLSILTETGLVGLTLFVAVIAAWAVCALRIARHAESPGWVRAHGLLMSALLANYFCSAVFHDLTLIASQHVLLFLFAGMTVNLREQFATAAAPQGATAGWPESTPMRWPLRLEMPAIPAVVNFGSCVTRKRYFKSALLDKPAVASQLEPVDVHQSSLHARNLFGMWISPFTMDQSVSRVLEWCSQPRSHACRYIVTPNVDHAVLFQHQVEFRAAYADASLVLADGAPLVFASRFLGRPLPERVAGSDLVPRLFAEAKQPLRVFLLGAAPGVAESAGTQIARQWPTVQIVGTYSPPLGFEQNELETRRILAAVADAEPDLLVVGLGAPKQELWVHRYHHLLQAKVAICAGATIDFLAGHRRRSPVWMRRCGLEWLHRVWSEPRRLAGRYARDAWLFPRLVWREWRDVKTT